MLARTQEQLGCHAVNLRGALYLELSQKELRCNIRFRHLLQLAQSIHFNHVRRVDSAFKSRDCFDYRWCAIAKFQPVEIDRFVCWKHMAVIIERSQVIVSDLGIG